MRLFIDPTEDGVFRIGAGRGRNITVQTVPLPVGRHEMVLQAVKRALSSQKISPGSIKEIGVISGPGRFSALRVAATIANVFSIVVPVTLYAKPKPKTGSIDPNSVFQSRYRVKLITPAYGKPPSITLPRAKSTNVARRSSSSRQKSKSKR